MKGFLFLALSFGLLCCTPKSMPPTDKLPDITNANDGKNPELTGTRWKLIELYGKEFKESAMGKPGFLLLQLDGRFSASAGCNTLMGAYEIAMGTRIRFKPEMASTMMACPDMETEQRFKEMLLAVNTVSLFGSSLSLSSNRMAPFARFEAVVQEPR